MIERDERCGSQQRAGLAHHAVGIAPDLQGQIGVESSQHRGEPRYTIRVIFEHQQHGATYAAKRLGSRAGLPEGTQRPERCAARPVTQDALFASIPQTATAKLAANQGLRTRAAPQSPVPTSSLLLENPHKSHRRTRRKLPNTTLQM